VGENYVRCNCVANEGIADLLEELGVEVHVQPLHEWIYYTNWTAGLHCRYEREYRGYVSLRLRDLVQRWDARRLARAADGSPRGPAEVIAPAPLARLLHLAAAYAPPTLEGEAVLATGTALDCHRRGMSGVIYVAPFGCIVGTVFETLAGRISEDLDGFPVLTAFFDGQGRSGLRDRLEVFLLRVRAWQAERGAGGR
jgi:predicted nucleotide-binding protein (sugar kinase/HSP70/actin superfamily)